MARYKLPDEDFVMHVVGNYTGHITEVIDQGVQSNRFSPSETQHQIRVKIESETALMDDGRPYIHAQWFNYSGGSRSYFTLFRQAVLGREMSKEERLDFDDVELIGKRISYTIVHSTNQSGNLRAYLEKNQAGYTVSLLDGEAPTSTGPEMPDDIQLDYFQRLLKVTEEHELITPDNVKAIRAQVSKITASGLVVYIERIVEKLTAENIPIPPEMIPSPDSFLTGDDDLPF